MKMNEIQQELKIKYNKIANQLFNEWNERNSIYFDRLEYFAKLMPEGSKLLDIGCGFGRDVFYFQQKGITSCGIDISDEMVRIGKEKYGNIDIFVEDFFNINSIYNSNEFYGIWIRGVTFHYSKLRLNPFFKSLNNILKQEGFLYLQVSNKKGNYKKNISNTSEKAQYYFYSMNQLLVTLNNVGFVLYEDLSNNKDICLVVRKK
jgi:SAM-dependent methyltransferase